MRTLTRNVLRLLLLVVVVAAASYPAASSAAAESSRRGALIGSTPVPYIFDILPDALEPGAVLLATSAGLYCARHDGSAERISLKRHPFWRLSASGTDGTHLLARGFADDSRRAAIVVSVDGGRRWQRLPLTSHGPRHLRIIEASKVHPNVVYASGYSFWRSIDGGRRWISTGVPPRRILDLAASALDVQRAFAATFSGLYVTEDGGLSWKRVGVGVAGCRQPVMAVATGTDGAVYAFSLCVGLLRGNELTGEWTIVNDRFGGCIVQHLAVDPGNSERLYAVLRCHRVLVSENGGVTWRELGSRETWLPACAGNTDGRADVGS